MAEAIKTSPTTPGSPAGAAQAPPALSVFDLAKAVVANVSRLYHGSPEVLRDEYTPERFSFRVKETQEVLGALAPAVSGHAPPHMVIQGRAGSGKSFILHQVIAGLKHAAPQPTPFTVAYVNCSLLDSDHAFLRVVASATVEGSAKAGGEKRGVDALLGEIQGTLTEKGHPIILVLDGVDEAFTRLGDEFLYSLLNMSAGNARISIVMVVRDPSFEGKLGIRTASRFLPDHVAFEPYDEQQVATIIGERARAAFGEDAEVHEAVEACATFAARQDGGNVRTALSTLRLAAKLAEEEGASVVSKEHVERAVSELHQETLSRQIRTMDTQDQAILHSILSLVSDTAEGTTSFEKAYEHYQHYCNAIGVQPFKERAARNRVEDIERKGFIKTRMLFLGRNGGRLRIISPAVSPGEGLRVLDGVLRPAGPGSL